VGLRNLYLRGSARGTNAAGGLRVFRGLGGPAGFEKLKRVLEFCGMKGSEWGCGKSSIT